MKKELKKWDLLSSECVFSTKWFKIRKDKVRLPNGEIYSEYYVKERPDWALLFCLTEEDQVLLLRTYKHGSQSFVYECPAGSLEPGEVPTAGILRELKEETGFSVTTENLFKVGTVLVDPVYVQANLHIFLGVKAKKIYETDYDPKEIFDIHFLPQGEIIDFIHENMASFPESQIAGIFLALDFLKRNKLP